MHNLEQDEKKDDGPDDGGPSIKALTPQNKKQSKSWKLESYKLQVLDTLITNAPDEQTKSPYLKFLEDYFNANKQNKELEQAVDALNLMIKHPSMACNTEKLIEEFVYFITVSNLIPEIPSESALEVINSKRLIPLLLDSGAWERIKKAIGAVRKTLSRSFFTYS